jgi:F0F1-type ATP synthase membrane subunit b/b'
MISVDSAMTMSFVVFFLVLGRQGIKTLYSFLEDNKKKILLSIQQSKNRFSKAQDHLQQAIEHKEKVSCRIDAMDKALHQEIAQLILEKDIKKSETERQYHDLYDQSFQSLLYAKKQEVVQKMMAQTRHFLSEHYQEKDLGIAQIERALCSKGPSDIVNH